MADSEVRGILADAAVMAATGDMTSACTAWETVVELGSKAADVGAVFVARRHLGLMALEAGDAAQALQHLTAAIQIVDDSLKVFQSDSYLAVAADAVRKAAAQAQSELRKQQWTKPAADVVTYSIEELRKMRPLMCPIPSDLPSFAIVAKVALPSSSKSGSGGGFASGGQGSRGRGRGRGRGGPQQGNGRRAPPSTSSVVEAPVQPTATDATEEATIPSEAAAGTQGAAAATPAGEASVAGDASPVSPAAEQAEVPISNASTAE